MTERIKQIRREPTEAMVTAAVTAIKIVAVAPDPTPMEVAAAALRAAWDAAPPMPELTLMERVARLEREIDGKMTTAGLAP